MTRVASGPESSPGGGGAGSSTLGGRALVVVDGRGNLAEGSTGVLAVLGTGGAATPVGAAGLPDAIAVGVALATSAGGVSGSGACVCVGAAVGVGGTVA